MTSTATHVWRLLTWGRTLARHGALRGIERDPNTPSPVRRLARLARLGEYDVIDETADGVVLDRVVHRCVRTVRGAR